MHGTVASTSFLGSLRRTTVRLDDDTIVSVQHGVEQQFLFGDAVALRLTGRPVASTPDGAA
nr:TOBE domain-containing protein [Frondihabitans sucicola]